MTWSSQFFFPPTKWLSVFLAPSPPRRISSFQATEDLRRRRDPRAEALCALIASIRSVPHYLTTFFFTVFVSRPNCANFFSFSAVRFLLKISDFSGKPDSFLSDPCSPRPKTQRYHVETRFAPHTWMPPPVGQFQLFRCFSPNSRTRGVPFCASPPKREFSDTLFRLSPPPTFLS